MSKYGQTLSNAEVETIERLTLAGRSSRLIAEELGLSQSTVSRLIRQQGWKAETGVVTGKDGKQRKGRRIKPNPHPKDGECGICDDPQCPGHLDELDAPDSIDLVPCWACSRKGSIGPAGHVPCLVCSAIGWVVRDADDRFPSNRKGVAWQAQYRKELENQGDENAGWLPAAVATALEREADWEATQELLGPRTVKRNAVVKRDWRNTGDLSPGPVEAA